jgi:amino acid transporter
VSIWAVATLSVLFTVYTPVYSTITAACVIFLYISYVIPTVLGFFAYGKSWTRMGPWSIGRWYRPLAVACVAGCALFIAVGMYPPNDKNLWIVAGAVVLTAIVWYGFERSRFVGPPSGVLKP